MFSYNVTFNTLTRAFSFQTMVLIQGISIYVGSINPYADHRALWWDARKLLFLASLKNENEQYRDKTFVMK